MKEKYVLRHLNLRPLLSHKTNVRVAKLDTYLVLDHISTLLSVGVKNNQAQEYHRSQEKFKVCLKICNLNIAGSIEGSNL